MSIKSINFRNMVWYFNVAWTSIENANYLQKYQIFILYLNC